MSDDELPDIVPQLQAVAARHRRFTRTHEFTSSGCHHEEHRDCELTCPYCCVVCRCQCHRLPKRTR